MDTGLHHPPPPTAALPEMTSEDQPPLVCGPLAVDACEERDHGEGAALLFSGTMEGAVA